MILDSEQQRKLLLEIFRVANFPGEVLELAAETKKAIQQAKIEEPTQP